MSVLIIGAGIAGLTAARELTQLGYDVTVLDKGRGVGGRMATRRIDRARADHGAQYITAQTPEFQQCIETLRAANTTAIWQSEEAVNYVGTGGMSGIAKHLAQGLRIELNEKVVRVAAESTGWLVQTEAGNEYRANALLLTIPVPQALALLNDSDCRLEAADCIALDAISYEPCLTVLATVERSGLIPAPGFWQSPTPDVAWVVDNQQKGISPEQPSVTIHASSSFSRENLDGDLEAAGRQLLTQLQRRIPAETVGVVQVHRWRYSHAERQHPAPFLAASAPFPLLFGGDGFGADSLSDLRSGVERAFVSGRAMAAFIISRVDSARSVSVG
ncbi:NAD(P)/FAD-dependent oxidoreductase [Spirosoma montaniterrae]|uniref:FAD-dependent oxidoreductase n=1 Tax=Spirosoma montaniterrae TaxID=1178516 RepID=A0A1P9WXT2_9BACT|nr:FAD-dependent oxidoreductase [Spirosoma montaniterrae]AQG80169.1 FAD-dependent oxidoreductase [Spirosoma montaniterrae]